MLTTVAKFRRPPTAKAWQWDGTQQTLDDVAAWYGSWCAPWAADWSYVVEEDGTLVITAASALDGTWRVPVGSWVVTLDCPSASLPPIDFVFASAEAMAVVFGDAATRP